MICSLSIRDLAVVKELDLDFRKGLTVLTGETGAGKSILLTALGLALGERADSSYIRPGAKKAEVTLEFDLADSHDAKQWLIESDLDEDQVCFIRRVVSGDGRSKAYINDRPVTLQFLHELSASLVEIHGQHAHLKLLQNIEQRRMLDDLAGNQEVLGKLGALFRKWKNTKTELDDLVDKAGAESQRAELLKFQIAELEQSDVESLDYPAISEEHRIHANMERILTLGQEQLQQLSEDEQLSVNSLLGRSIQAMSELSELSSDFGEILTLLNDALVQVQESTHLLRRRLDSLESDPKQLEWLEECLSLVHGLSKKYQTAPENLTATLYGLRNEIETLQENAEGIDKLKEKIDALQADYVRLANTLSERRTSGAQSLQKRISSIIKELGMPHGEFIIEVTQQSKENPRAEGSDQVEFLISTNLGLPPRPIGKIASGGELSRISLAIQVAAMNGKTTPTMVFDEVDSGIGGGVAEVVGKRLRALGESKQVFCVTHLPQVAAQSHEHLFVQKHSDGELTHSKVNSLTGKERKCEIARMLGGIKITDQTLAHAQEMLQWNDESLSQ